MLDLLLSLFPTPGDVVAALVWLALGAGAVWVHRHPDHPRTELRVDYDVEPCGARIVIVGEGVRLVDDHRGYEIVGPYDWTLEQA